ncbi:rCG44749 [Rattus norvegicus]|uniref:RCG44749 n=1 Tax=Rattus norvegicus TaxID=10116 RepID=A6I4Z2_RAT|nr:rCG44749 [Rattus norvegicus]
MNCWRYTGQRSGSREEKNTPPCSRMGGTPPLADHYDCLRTVTGVFCFHKRVDVSPSAFFGRVPSPWLGILLQESPTPLPACPPSWRWLWRR